MFKQVIIVRKDLKWGKGKLGSHCAHASVGAVRKAKEEIVEKWEKEGAKKIVLKVKDLKELKEIYKKVKDAKLPHFLVRDAGLTQLKKGTVTCLGIGPAEDKKIDRITGKLKLL
jgi:PTH2 family peptidyl-tRNA hydrolase